MVLAIRGVHSPDVDGVARWVPEDPDDVCIVVEVEIGEGERGAADLFQILVATPKGLERYARDRQAPVVSERGMLVLKRYSFGVVRSWLEQTVARCTAPTWEASIPLLQRYLAWEYET